jgi:hypothetical protein
LVLIDRERGTLLAALRLWQRHGPLAANSMTQSLSPEERAALLDVATDGGAFTPLAARDIDKLCEELNGSAEPDESICDCQLPGFFCSGVPSIIAHVVHCRLPPGSKVERCDVCQRYPSDEAALAKLRELGFCPAQESIAPNL